MAVLGPDPHGPHTPRGRDRTRGSGGVSEDRPQLRGDESELYATFNPWLLRWVKRRTRSAPELVEEACSYAWQEFLRHQPDRDRSWRGWLMRTAERELWHLQAKESTQAPIDVQDSDRAQAEMDNRLDTMDRVDKRERLGEALEALVAVPERRRRIKVLKILGYSYEEIGELTGLSYTQVNRLLVEASRRLREERERLESPMPSTRSERLEQLERTTPAWLRRTIGRLPAGAGDPATRLAWRRAALAIDDYRRRHGTDLGDDPPGPRPAEPVLHGRMTSPER